MNGLSFIRLTALAIALAATATMSRADEFALATAEHERRLSDAIRRLGDLRHTIQTAQIPLARGLREKRETVNSQRETLRERRAQQARQRTDLQSMETRLQALRYEYDYVTRTLFSEYFATYDAGLSPAERITYGETLRTLNVALQNDAADEDRLLQRSLELMRESLAHLNGVVGGKRFPGEALDTSDRMVPGTFIQAGPAHYFVSADEKAAGLIEESLGGRARTRPLGDQENDQLYRFVGGEGATLPVDPSQGNALLLAETEDSFLAHLEKGGVWVYPILFFALISSVVGLLKCGQIFRLRLPDPIVAHQLAQHVRAGEMAEASSLVARQPQPAREMLAAAVDHADEPLELVEEVMYESMLGVQPRLDRFLNVIAVTAATAPLLGLLGTVTGIIKTFKLMNVFGAGDPKPLITGISEALITTELGLVLAIPALILHAFLTRKSAGVMARLEKLAVALVNSLSRRRAAETEVGGGA